MKIKNKKLNPDIIIEMDNNEMVSAWHELEDLTDKGMVENNSSLFKLKLAIKNNIFELNKFIEADKTN